MSELKEYTADDIQELDDKRLEESESGKIYCTRVYIKYEADKVIAEKDAEIVELKKQARHDEELTRLKARIAELEKENQTLAEDVSDKIESITELIELVEKYKLRKALGEYRWHSPCDDRPPEWSCVIVYFHNEKGVEQYRLAIYSKENGWEVGDEEVYKTAEIEAWHPLPMPPMEEK